MENKSSEASTASYSISSSKSKQGWSFIKSNSQVKKGKLIKDMKGTISLDDDTQIHIEDNQLTVHNINSDELSSDNTKMKAMEIIDNNSIWRGNTYQFWFYLNYPRIVVGPHCKITINNCRVCVFNSLLYNYNPSSFILCLLLQHIAL